jgi:hypothetical protein
MIPPVVVGDFRVAVDDCCDLIYSLFRYVKSDQRSGIQAEFPGFKDR